MESILSFLNFTIKKTAISASILASFLTGVSQDFSAWLNSPFCTELLHYILTKVFNYQCANWLAFFTIITNQSLRLCYQLIHWQDFLYKYYIIKFYFCQILFYDKWSKWNRTTIEKISSPTNQSGEHSFVIAIQIPRRMITQYFSFSFDIYIISKIFKNIKLKGQPLFYVPVAARVFLVFLQPYPPWTEIRSAVLFIFGKVKQFSFRNFLNNIITKIFIFVKADDENRTRIFCLPSNVLQCFQYPFC